ncbi:MAG: MMPL family transporter [Dehalobacterium sp.]
MHKNKKTNLLQNIFKNKSDDLANFIVDQRKWIERIFILLIIISIPCFFLVQVNYDLTEYLPDDSLSKQGVTLMKSTFGLPGSARVMIKDVSIYKAKIYKDKLENIDGVDMVLWADMKADIFQSSLFIQYQDIEDYYKDNCAVMDVTFKEGDSSARTHKAIDAIKKLTGDKGCFSGPAIQDKFLRESLSHEVKVASVFVVAIILLFLSLATTSWFEPILFLMVIFISIVINMGSNLIIGKVSFLTQNVAAILQLAIAIDYTIILLDAFTRERNTGEEPGKAIRKAIKSSLTPILSAGGAAIVGFIVLALMRFSIGYDLGLVLAKGIFISLITILFLMPALILRWHHKIEKYAHRSFIPSFRFISEKIHGWRYLIVGIVLLIAVPSFVAKEMNAFSFGTDALGASEGTKIYEDDHEIIKHFGRNNLLLILIPQTSRVTEKLLAKELENLDCTQYVASLANILPEGIPTNILPESVTSQLYKDGYARMVVSIKTASESKLAFQSTDEVRKIVSKYYPTNSFVLGTTPATQDIKRVIVDDYTKIDLLSLFGVALAIMIAFKSPSLPPVLMIPILIAVFINMAIPYLKGDSLVYLGYIIVSCLQLGATIDYSILLTHNYIEHRKHTDAHEAAIQSTAISILPISLSGLILSATGYCLNFTSSVPAIADLGELIGRGALLSMLSVILLLPNLLIFADKIIFYHRKKSSPEQKHALTEAVTPKSKKAKEEYIYEG